MVRKITKNIAAMLVAVILISFTSFINVNAFTLTDDEVDLYALNSNWDGMISIPSSYTTQYQITPSGSGTATYRVLSQNQAGYTGSDYKSTAVTVSATGLVEPGIQTWYWKNGFGSTGYIEDYTRIELRPITGTAVVRVTVGSEYHDITFHTIDYAGVYYNEQVDNYIASHITPDMSVKEIATAAAVYAASFNYSASYSSAAGMVISGGGDCWASTSLVCDICSRCGLKAWARAANRDAGAGSGHRNAMVEDPANGVWYLVDAGYSEPAPRYYIVGTRTSLFSYKLLWVDGQNYASVYQYDADPDTYAQTTVLEVPSEIASYPVCGIYDTFLYGDTYVQQVVLPDSIQSINARAFFNCTNLKEINIPLATKTIGEYAFFNCNSLTDVYYAGTEEEWNNITIEANNDTLLNATIHFRKTGWVKEDNVWHYYDDNGQLMSGWITLDGTTYYLDPSNGNAMATGWKKIDGSWYYFSASGAMTTGWKKISGKWYFLDRSSGAMVTGGWNRIDGKWYYFTDSGAIAIGWKKIDGDYYFFNAAGEMQKGWVKDNGKWYYMNASGVMVTGWKYINKVWYYFDQSGAMLADTTVTIDGVEYTFASSGALQ